MRKLSYIEYDARPVLDETEREAFENALNKRFENHLGQSAESRASQGAELFKVEASFNAGQVQLRITLSSLDGMKGYPVETILCAPESESFTTPGSVPRKELGVLMDFQDAYWTEYFQSGRETFVTLDWSEHHFAGHQIFIRGFERDFALEKAAAALFAEHGMGNHDIEPISSET